MESLKNLAFGGRNQVGRRLIVLIIAFSSLITLCISVVQLIGEYRSLRSALDQQLDGVRIYVPSVAGSVWDFDQQQVKRLLDALILLPNIAHVEVVASDTRSHWSSGAKVSDDIVTRHYSLRHEVRGVDTEIGILTVIAGLDGINRQVLASAVSIILSNALKTFLVALFMVYLIRKVVTSRLEKMATKVHSLFPDILPLRQGVASEPQPIPPALDELDAVDWTLDKTAEDLGIAVAALSKLNEQLEQRVEERTRELRREEERFRSFVENVNDVLFALTPDGCFSYLSPRWTEAFGHEIADSIGRSFTPFVHPDDVPGCVAFMQKIFSSGDQQSGLEYRVLCKDGRSVWYRANASRVIDSQSGVPMLVGIGRDIDAMKSMEAALLAAKLAAETASQAKSRFLAAASHDLRQPIQAINMFHGVLRQTRLDERQRQLCGNLAHSIDSLGDILDALLDVSQLDAGIVAPKRRAVAVSELIERLAADWSQVAVARSLRLRFRCPKRPLAVDTDPSLLLRLLGNLIDNALRHTRRGGVLVSFRRRGGGVLIEVRDTGVGIAGEYLENIFEEYFQVGNPERDRSKGLGLGLSIVRRLAELLGARVRARSNPGRGSCFDLALACAEPAIPLGSPAAGDHQTPCSGRRVIVLEDNPNVAEAMRLSLESCDMVVEIYASAEEALARADLASADFYISDLRLPGMDGVQFLETVRQRVGRPIRALLLTGDLASDGNECASASSWPPVLFKPVPLSNLVAAMEAQFRASR